MAVIMSFLIFTLLCVVVGAHAAGELTIIYSPQSLKFTGSAKTSESNLKEIFSAALGLSVEENSEWNGLTIVDPFSTPEAVVEVYVDGVSSLGNIPPLSKNYPLNFPLTVDEYEPDTFEALSHRIKQRFANGANKLIDIKLSDFDELTAYPDVFGEIKPPKAPKQTLQHLKSTIEEDNQFLTELEALKAITKKVKYGVISADNIIDFYTFKFRSLHALSDFHGPNSLQTKEAKKLLGAALHELASAFVGAYSGSVLVTAAATDVEHTRRAGRAPRAAVAVARDAAASTNYTDDSYSADYAAIFNIILWFGVVFVFALISIVYAIMDMDPGRDSIIYRMTSTRMKKDN